MAKNLKITIIAALVFVVIGIVSRTVPHVWNATPIVAVTLFAGVYLRRGMHFIIPLGIIFFSDLIIGFYNLGVMASVYGSFIFIALLSRFLTKETSVLETTFFAGFSSTLFFFITNAAVWAFGTMYPHTFGGLIQSYVNGLPFYKNMLIGDLIFTSSFFALYRYVTIYVPSRRINQEKKQPLLVSSVIQ